MTKERVKRLANYLLFQIGWFICAIGTDDIALYITCTIVFIHVIAIGSWRKEKEILVICLLLGSTIDSFLGNLNVLQFSGEGKLLPVWLACMWVLLGTTIKHSLAWVGQHWTWGAILGFLGGPTAYYGGSQLSDVRLGEPLWQTLLILATIWAVIFPLLFAFSKAWQKRLEKPSEPGSPQN